MDGNDPLAVFLVCQEARARAVATQQPILIEALSYRAGHHSTSDDASAYRSPATALHKLASPHARLRQYLATQTRAATGDEGEGEGGGGGGALWTAEMEAEMKAGQRRAIMEAFKAAEREKKPRMEEMFGDVYAPIEGGEASGGARLERPQREQRAEVGRLVRKWGNVGEWADELARFEGGKGEVEKW